MSVAVEVTRWNCGGGRDEVSMRRFWEGGRGEGRESMVAGVIADVCFLDWGIVFSIGSCL